MDNGGLASSARDTEPLIRPEDSSSAPHGQEAAAVEAALVRPGWFVWVLTLAAGVSGLLFGYDTGIISSTLVSISSSLSNRQLTTLDKSLITSSTSLFALIASPITGLLADAFGRRRVILVASLLFAAGALLQAFSNTVPLMIVGRSVVGLAVGSASFVVPLYISELSPAPFRGRLVVVSSLFITGGQVVAYLVGWALSSTDHGWRWMVGLGALPAFLQLVMLVGMPETPRWLIKVGHAEDAERILNKVYGGQEENRQLVRSILRQVQAEVDEEEQVSVGRIENSAKFTVASKFAGIRFKFGELLHIGANRRALVIACTLQASQQLCGFNSLMYFAATIFSLVGFSSPTLTSLTVAVSNFVFTVVAFYAIDRIGRRRILLMSVPFMSIAMGLAAISFGFLDLNAPPDTASNPNASKSFWSIFLLASTVVYVSSYALGLGNVPWQQSELFALSVRSVGSGLATATNWGSNTVVGLTFLPMMDILTPSGAFAVFALVCIVSWVVIWQLYPETAGLGLEDVGSLLKDGFGVEESMRLWEARRRKYHPSQSQHSDLT